MGEKKTTDMTLLFVTIILLGIGLSMVYSSSSVVAYEDYEGATFFFKKQFFRMLIGVTAMLILMRLNYRIFRPLARPLLFIGVAGLLILLYMKYIQGYEGVNGSVRWLDFGIFKVQPSEAVRLFVIFYLATVLSESGRDIRDLKKGFLPLLGVIGVVLLMIILQPDLSMTVSLATIFFLMVYFGGALIKHIAGAMAVGLTFIIYKAASMDYVRGRFHAWLDPASHAEDVGYQMTQSLLSLGNGGVFGVGLGEGIGKSHFLPEPHTDFVFAVIGEEVGLVGSIVVLFLFLVYIWCGLRIIRSAPDDFGFYTAAGITLMIGMGSFINIGVVLGVLPTAGMTLPFISYGGSSLVLSLSATGVLLSIGRRSCIERGFNTWVRKKKTYPHTRMRFYSRVAAQPGMSIRP